MRQSNYAFTEQIQRVFEERCKKNPQYSLRAFARAMNMSPASLSGILSGKRKPSLKMIEKIGIALGLKSHDILKNQKEFLGFELTKAQQKFANLEQDVFSIIADWYHLTILEVMKLNDFQPDIRWVASKLDVNINQIKIATERLERLGILEITNDGKWIDKTNGFTTHYQKEKTSEARKSYQLQLLEKSKESILRDDFSVRDHSSMTMAIDPKDIMRAKDEIIEFRKKLSSILEGTKNRKEVYQLQIALFPLTRKKG